MSNRYLKSEDVPIDVLVKRLRELGHAVTIGERGRHEFMMRVPVEIDRDADIVLMEAATRLEALGGEDE